MTGREKSEVCSAIARGLARANALAGDEEIAEAIRQEFAIAIGDELEQTFGAGYGGQQMLVRLDVVRMSGEAQ